MRGILIAVVLLWTVPTEAASLNGIVSQLQSQCGSKVISATRPQSFLIFRKKKIPSCHAMGQAVDMVGNYGCMYRVLAASWPGGYTTDAGRCKHIHISSCRREWGLRFRHRSC